MLYSGIGLLRRLAERSCGSLANLTHVKGHTQRHLDDVISSKVVVSSAISAQ